MVIDSHPTQQTSAITQQNLVGNACNKHYIGELRATTLCNKPFHEGVRKFRSFT